jgi:hypothetical protein
LFYTTPEKKEQGLFVPRKTKRFFFMSRGIDESRVILTARAFFHYSYTEHNRMQNSESTRPCLERLTTRELARMADREGIDIPPDLDRIFIIQELLEYAGQDQRPPEPEVAPPGGRLEPVPLPRRYNITWLELLPRDPLWVFAFWEIKAQDRERLEASPDFEGYCLRGRLMGTDMTFSIAVGNDDNAWYLGFPSQRGPYTVELGVNFRQDGRGADNRGTERHGVKEPVFKTLAASAPFVMPRLPDPVEREECLSNSLLRLSGAESFLAFRGGDRLSRVSS